MKSKIELRLEAAKLVMQLPDTTIDNFHERAYRIGLYLQGDTELPEHVDELGALNEYLGKQIKLWEQQNQEHQRRMNEMISNFDRQSMFDKYVNNTSARAYRNKPEECFSPNGIPSSEGEALFLQEDGEKVE